MSREAVLMQSRMPIFSLLSCERELSPKERLFSDRDIMKMAAPLFVEQVLVVLLGLSDTFMVSFIGEAAVSGVALVDQFNLIFLYLSIALGAGGAVIVSQYLGAGDRAKGNRAAGQLFMSACLLAIAAGGLIWLFHRPLLAFLFGQVESDVMGGCCALPDHRAVFVSGPRYLQCGYGHPAQSWQYESHDENCGCQQCPQYRRQLHRHLRPAGRRCRCRGAAVPTVLARWFSAMAITVITFRANQPVFYEWRNIFTWDGSMLRRILGVAVPNAVESSFFQLMKVALITIIALFGTAQIAANGVAQSIWSVAAMFGVTMGYIFITVIGRCMGAGEVKAADFYFRKLSRMTLFISAVWNLVVLGLTLFILPFYPLADETKELVILLVILHNICNALFFPFSQSLSSGLRAAGDVRVTMYISIFATLCRVAFAVILGIYLNLGVIGVALAMCLDWLIRAVLMIRRWQSGIWKTKQLI